LRDVRAVVFAAPIFRNALDAPTHLQSIEVVHRVCNAQGRYGINHHTTTNTTTTTNNNNNNNNNETKRRNETESLIEGRE